MSVLTVVKRFAVANFLTVFYCSIALFKLLLKYVTNPLGDMGPKKLKLEPPACLVDPKYGVHKYIKANVSTNNAILRYLCTISG